MTSYLLNLTAVLIGGAIGGASRYFVAGAVTARLGAGFPWGTLTVNASGALAVGVLTALLAAGPLAAATHAQWLLIAGFCGSYTTVSSFALQTLALAQNGLRFAALANVIASLALCLLAVWIGLAAGTAMLRLGGS
jgi:fluoride exporter